MLYIILLYLEFIEFEVEIINEWNNLILAKNIFHMNNFYIARYKILPWHHLDIENFKIPYIETK